MYKTSFNVKRRQSRTVSFVPLPSKTVDVGGASLFDLLQPHAPVQVSQAVLWKGKIRGRETCYKL